MDVFKVVPGTILQRAGGIDDNINVGQQGQPILCAPKRGDIGRLPHTLWKPARARFCRTSQADDIMAGSMKLANNSQANQAISAEDKNAQ